MEILSVEDPICALASPWGESALAVIRISGKDSLKLLCPLFTGKVNLLQTQGHTIHYGLFQDPQSSDVIDQIMLAVYRAPGSYTGENSVEIFCHGSLAIINKILQILLSSGFRQAGPGEFTQRAFLNGKMDLTRAEAVNEIIRAKTDRARALALNRLSGTIEQKINGIKADLADLLSAVEIELDYPEEELDQARSNWQAQAASITEELSRLLISYHTGKLIQEGVSVVIAGCTNAGKSTLFNLLLREDRAIVSEFHGTTRDYLEGLIVIRGIPIRLFDTAGLRRTDNPVEQEGIRRTDNLMTNAALILFVIDACRGLNPTDLEFLEKYNDRTTVLKIWNKSDLATAPCPAEWLALSSRTGAGLEQLNQEIVRRLMGEVPLDTDGPVIDSLRQKELLEKCQTSLRVFREGLAGESTLDLLAVDLKEALDCLGEITGAVSSEEILQKMFAKFCVGK